MKKTYKLVCGDCLEKMKKIPDNYVDAIVTDPPAGIAFMGKKWDGDRGGKSQWIAWMKTVAEECLRVIKPGGHALVWAIPRTSHWTATAWEDAGFEIRDCIYFLCGQGFPKNLDVGKAIDKYFDAEREVVGKSQWANRTPNGCQGIRGNSFPKNKTNTAPATKEAKQWGGFGTALKPAVECWWLLRKPLSEKTVAANVLKWGTGGLNIDACRIGTEERMAAFTSLKPCHGNSLGKAGTAEARRGTQGEPQKYVGRFPANIIHDGSEQVVGMFPETTPSKASARGGTNPNPMDWGGGRADGSVVKGHDDSGGSAARFFYAAKPSKREKTEQGTVDNNHPTVKSVALMKYLVRLVTATDAIVLDPFMGSSTTGVACGQEGRKFIGIEMEEEYFEIAKKRIKKAYSSLRWLEE